MKQNLHLLQRVRFVTAQETASTVLYHEDIDLTKMNNLAKVEEEQHKNRYLSYAEQQSTRKSDGEFHYTPMSTTRNYYDEESLTETVLYHLPTWKPSMRKYFQKLLTGFQLVSIL
jgi:tRNA(Leu) C34 or U34 (ribose-2'-O)-methylase TrmL